jgi:hypothetical protein
MMLRIAAVAVGLATVAGSWQLLDTSSERVDRLTAPLAPGESRFSDEELAVLRAEIRHELDELVSDEPVPVESLRTTVWSPNPLGADLSADQHDSESITAQLPALPDGITYQPVTTTTLVPADARCPQWWVVAVGAGWPTDPAVLEVLDWLMWRESRCQADAVGDGSYGLTQLQWSVHEGWISELGFDRDELLEPAANLALAWHLYRLVDDDPNYRCGFSPWYPSQPGKHWCQVLEELS